MFKLLRHDGERWVKHGYFASQLDAASVAGRLGGITRVVPVPEAGVIDRFLVEALDDASDEAAAVIHRLRERAKNWTPKESHNDDEH